MTAAKIDQLRLDVEELTKMSELATRQKVKDILLLGIRKIETEISLLKEKLSKEDASPTKDAVAAHVSKVTSTTKSYSAKITSYGWDQTPKLVKVIVSLPEVEKLPKENITCNFTNRSMDLHINGLDNKNYHLPLLNLNNKIDPEKCAFKVKTGTVIVNMVKATPSENWSDIVAKDNTSKYKPPNMDPSEEPSQALMTMLKQMYEEGDDTMKRTIAKAWSSQSSPNFTS